MFVTEMDLSSKDIKTHHFDGRLQESSLNNLSDFADKQDIKTFSRALIELLAALEWSNESKSPPIQDTAIYTALLRLEKSMQQTSSWEIYNTEEVGQDFDISNFEANMLEQNMSIYVVDLLHKKSSQILFFPLNDLYKTDAIIKWRTLEKIASIKITPQETIYKQKLQDALERRIESEVSCWLENEFQQLKMSGKNTVLKDTEALTKIVKELKSQVAICIDVITAEGSLFESTSCCYFDCLSKGLQNKLHPVCIEIMKSMDIYQEYHKNFHVNLRDSCALTYALYRQIKSLIYCIQIGNPKTQRLNFEEYSVMFVKCFMNFLQVTKLECHFRIKRAVDFELKNNINTDEKILSSSVITLNCLCTVIDEWKHMEIDDEDLQIAFMIKITDIICDGAKIYAESLTQGLRKTESLNKETDFSRKICIFANSVEHVREYLSELSLKMKWEEFLSKLKSTAECDMKEQVSRILNLVHESMDLQLQHIVQSTLEYASSNLFAQWEKQISSWLRPPMMNQSYERLECLLDEHLINMNEIMKETLFPKFVSLLWSSILICIQKEFLEGEPPEYAETLKENMERCRSFFININMEEVDSHKPIWQQIMSLIDLNSKSTVDLQLDYYSQVAESLVSPVEYLGHIAFQAGYKITGEDFFDLYINIQKGQRLPARSFEMSELYVKIALCPSTMFPNHVPFKSETATEDLDNPVFNQLFQFSKLPLSVLSVKGAVVQVHVLNQDNSYSAEAVLLLKQIQNMSGFSSIEFLPVYLLALKKFDMSQISYQVLENRSRWDKIAKHFINSRVKITKRQKKFMPCIPGKKSCFF